MGELNTDLGVFKKTELFSNLKESQIDFIVSHSQIVDLPKKKQLFSAGEKAAQFYKLISGEIRVYHKNKDGNEEEMAHFKPGDTIGDFDFVRRAEYNALPRLQKIHRLSYFRRKAKRWILLPRKILKPCAVLC